MRRMKRVGTGAFAALLVLSSAAVAAPETRPPADVEQGASAQSDQEFLTKAFGVNQLELELARLAVERASTPEVKTMGQKMIQKHTELGQQLSQLAQQSGVALKTDLSPEQKETVARVGALSGSAFDTEFKRTVDAGHVKELAMYEQEASHAANPQLRALSEQRVKTLKESLAKVQAPAKSQEW